MRSLGSSVDIAQKPNKSGQILDQRWKILFVMSMKLVPCKILYCKHFGVDGIFSLPNLKMVTPCLFHTICLEVLKVKHLLYACFALQE